MSISALNLANCSTQGNLGATFCNIEPSYFSYVMPIPKGFVIPNSVLTNTATVSIWSYLQSVLWSNSRTARAQISPKLVDFKDMTKEPIEEDLDNFPVLTSMPPYVWSYRFANKFSGATKNLYQIWQTSIHQQQSQYDWLFIDSNNVLIGASALDSTGAAGLGGVAMSNQTVRDWMQATIKSANQYSLKLVIADNASLNVNFAAVQLGGLASTLRALTDVSLAIGATANTTTHIYVTGRIGGNTIGKQYGATLAAALTAFVILDTTNSSKTWTTSAVSYDAVKDHYDITGSWSAANVGDTVSVSMATPSVMTVTPYFAPITTEGTNVLTFVAP
jgi:hypothetical protein